MKKAIRWILGVIGAMVAVPLVGFALLLLSRFGLMAQKIDIAVSAHQNHDIRGAGGCGLAAVNASWQADVGPA